MLEFLTVLGRRWRIVAAFVVLGVAAAAVLTNQVITPSYRAEAQLYVAFASGGDQTTAADQSAGQLFVANRVKSYTDLVGAPGVLDPVIEELGLDTTSQALAGSISATAPTNTVLILIQVDNGDPQLAADIANSVATNLATYVQDLDKVSADTPSPVRVSVTNPATPPGSPRTPVPLLNIAIGLFAGLALGLVGATVREALDTTIKDESDVEEAVGLATLAAVPTNPDITGSPVLAAGVSSPVWSESYRKLRTNISYLDPDKPPRTLLVTSALQGDGKTVTAANLAASLGQSGRSTILVEADLRRPSVSKLLGIIGDVGVTTVIAGKVALADVIQECDGFSVITSGPIPPNPSELLGSQAFQSMIDTLLESYDNVIVDTPPLIAVTDAAVASKVADAVIVVCQAKRTRRPDLARALFGLRAVDANVAGVVINQVPMSTGAYYQYSYTASVRRRASTDA